MMLLVLMAVAILAAPVVAVVPAMAQGSEKLGFGDKVSVQVTKGSGGGAASAGNNGTGAAATGSDKGGGQTAQQPDGQQAPGQLTATGSGSGAQLQQQQQQQQNQKPSGCLIATAAFGSELTPQVQFLRGFRDNRILSTQAGSSFMNVFNSWYYSFSPQVADYEREQPWLQQSIKAAIYPLLGILYISEGGYSVAQGEGGALVAGFAASSLIGLVYLAPAAAATVAVAAKRNRNRKGATAAVDGKVKPAITVLAVALAASLGLIAAGVASGNTMLLMGSTAAFVLSSIGAGFLGTMAIIAKMAFSAKKSSGG
jgi:peptide/nickel transport system substrate-binding protein